MCLVFRCDDEKYDGSTRSLCQLVSCGDHMHVKFTGRSSIFAFTFGHNGAPTYKGGGWEREIYIYIWDMRSVLLLVLTMCFVFFHPEVLKKLSSFWCIYHLLFYCHHNPKLTWIEFSILYGHTMKCKGVPQIGLWWSCMELWRVRSCISEAPLEAIKKIRERELHRLEAMVGVPITSGPWTTPTSKPFDLMLLSMSGYTRDSSLTYNGYYNTLIQPQLNKLRVFAYAYGWRKQQKNKVRDVENTFYFLEQLHYFLAQYTAHNTTLISCVRITY